MGKALPNSMTGTDNSAFSIGKITILVSLRNIMTAFYHVTFRGPFSRAEELLMSWRNFTHCQQRL